MHCVRCQGTMVTDYFIDMENRGELWMPGWRCLACGEVVDPLIMKHRLAQEKTPEVAEAATRKKCLVFRGALKLLLNARLDLKRTAEHFQPREGVLRPIVVSRLNWKRIQPTSFL